MRMATTNATSTYTILAIPWASRTHTGVNAPHSSISIGMSLMRTISTVTECYQAKERLDS
jgi:hypothetical protein